MTAGGFGQGDGATFGQTVDGGWNESPLTAEDSGELLPGGGHMTLKNGAVLKLEPDRWLAFLHSPEVVDAITQRAQDICQSANELYALDPRSPAAKQSEGLPPYKITVQNRNDTKRARARVYPGSIAGAIDNAHNSTLYKAMNTHPSDPIPQGYGPERDDAQMPGEAHDGYYEQLQERLKSSAEELGY